MHNGFQNCVTLEILDSHYPQLVLVKRKKSEILEAYKKKKIGVLTGRQNALLPKSRQDEKGEDFKGESLQVGFLPHVKIFLSLIGVLRNFPIWFPY